VAGGPADLEAIDELGVAEAEVERGRGAGQEAGPTGDVAHLGVGAASCDHDCPDRLAIAARAFEVDGEPVAGFATAHQQGGGLLEVLNQQILAPVPVEVGDHHATAVFDAIRMREVGNVDELTTAAVPEQDVSLVSVERGISDVGGTSVLTPVL